MRKIEMESRTRISEDGRSTLYEKRYCGILTENGGVRLTAYYAKRIPLDNIAAVEAPAQAERTGKGAA